MQLSPEVVTQEETLEELHLLQEVVQLDLDEVDQQLLDCRTPSSKAACAAAARITRGRIAQSLRTLRRRMVAKYLETMLVPTRNP